MQQLFQLFSRNRRGAACYCEHMPFAHNRKQSLTADIVEDIHAPINVDANTHGVRMAIKERIAFLLSERSLHSRRTKIRLNFEVYARNGSRDMNYIRIPGEHVLISCPTPAQARAVIKLLQKVCSSLDGKWLVEEE